MSDRFFLDTNILVYAYDDSNAVKHAKALALIETISKSGVPIVSTQVLQELAVCLRKKARPLLNTGQIQKVLMEIVQAWEVFVNSTVAVVLALDLEDRFQISFWDAMILQAAQASASTVLYTEDLNHGQSYGGVRVMNPFKI